MKIYQLKVSLFGYHEQPINSLHRIIEISENSTFEDLHDIIFEAFDRFDPHLYTFFMTKKDSKDMRIIMDAQSITNPFTFEEDDFYQETKPANATTTTIEDAKLNEKDVFHYWFDFGDDWWHRIRVEKITTNTRRKKAFAKIIKRVGQSPAQYEDFDIDEMDEGLFEYKGIAQTHLDELDIDEDDLVYFMQTLQKNSSVAMIDIVEKYGVDKVASILQLTGAPNMTKIKVMLKNLPIMCFLESVEAPNITLQQEHDALAKLIESLKIRLGDLKKKIAQEEPEVKSTPKE